jgi:membrane-bound serine protease (ClpP class)
MLVDYALFEGPLIVLGIVLGILLVISIVAVVRSQKRAVAAGRETLVGRPGVVRTPLKPGGTVLVDGELWNAVTDGPHLTIGEPIVVTGTAELILRVRRKEETHG